MDKLTIELEGSQAKAFELTLNTFCDWLVEYQKQTGKSPAEITMGLSLLANDLDLTLKMATTLGLGVINNKLMQDGVINDEDIFAALGIENPVQDVPGSGTATGSPTNVGSTNDSYADAGNITGPRDTESATGNLSSESDPGDA
jgi:hypothetical protein